MEYVNGDVMGQNTSMVNGTADRRRSTSYKVNKTQLKPKSSKRMKRYTIKSSERGKKNSTSEQNQPAAVPYQEKQKLVDLVGVKEGKEIIGGGNQSDNKTKKEKSEMETERDGYVKADKLSKITPKVEKEYFCDLCEDNYEDFCKNCCPLSQIFDDPIALHSTVTPKKYFEVKKIESNRGVFACVKVPKNVIFGPMGGRVQKCKNTNSFSWILKNGKFITGKNTHKTSWMVLVNWSKSFSEFNLDVFQYEGDLYFISLKDIEVGEELLLCYGEKFCGELLTNNKICYRPRNEVELRSAFGCSWCCLGFPSKYILGVHKERCSFKENVSENFDGVSLLVGKLTTREDKDHAAADFIDVNEENVEGDVEINLKNQTKSVNVFECAVCKVKIFDKFLFKKHTLTHCDTIGVYCYVCKREFSTRKGLISHVYKHLKRNKT